jgi:hypothetical protein
VALACATMPILGARDPVTVRGTSALLDHPKRVAAATAGVVALSVISTVQYVTYWVDTMPARPYFTQLLHDVRAAKEPVPLVDQPVPGFVMWAIGYPENLLSHLLVPYADHVDYVDIATDHVDVVDSKGHIVPALVHGVRFGQPGPDQGCGWAVRSEPVSIPLNGPAAFGNWWVRIGYLSSGTSPVTVSAGDASYSTVVKPGVHAIYLRGGTAMFDHVELSGLADGVTLCTNDVQVGRIRPVTEPGETSP